MISPGEEKKLLESRARRLLQTAGYGLRVLQGGGYQVLGYGSDLSEKVLIEFNDIISLGITFGFWGFEDGTPGDRDAQGKDKPYTAAGREKIR